VPWFLPRNLQCFVGAAQMERKLNLRLRIILKALLAGAMRVTRSCRRAVDKGTSVYRVRGVYLMDINQIKSRGAGRFHDTSTQGISRPSDLGSGFRWVCTLQPSYPCRFPSLPLLRLVYFGPFPWASTQSRPGAEKRLWSCGRAKRAGGSGATEEQGRKGSSKWLLSQGA
jgi:hypothetical protein